MRRIFALPFLVILMGIGAAAMYVPALYAYGVRDMRDARVFFYGGTLFLFLTAMIAIASSANPVANQTRRHLLALLAAFALLPVMLAVPFHEAIRNTTFLNAYFEMVSSLTTTGATLYVPAERLSDAVQLWRALVGWMGGALVWLMAIAILAPLNLGGFEVTSTPSLGGARWSGPFGAHAPGSRRTRFSRIAQASSAPERLTYFAARLLPIYAGLTGALWLGLFLAGDGAFVAAAQAMSTLATSAISPISGPGVGPAGRGGELLVFLFLGFALSRRSFLFDRARRPLPALLSDPEFRMGLMAVTLLPVLLSMRHWLGAIEVNAQLDPLAALRSLWGGAFTVLSFLTTNGVQSVDWATARDWSGLQTPGLLLVGLALIGGGVGTTAGGVKLLRVYALFKHGQREVQRMVHPSSVAGHGAQARHIRREGAVVAWVVFSLFALSIAIVILALALTGLDFQAASIFGAAAFTTTGPLAQIAANPPLSYADLSDWAKMILIVAMVVGRLGTLSIIVLLNPDLWRA